MQVGWAPRGSTIWITSRLGGEAREVQRPFIAGVIVGSGWRRRPAAPRPVDKLEIAARIGLAAGHQARQKSKTLKMRPCRAPPVADPCMPSEKVQRDAIEVRTANIGQRGGDLRGIAAQLGDSPIAPATDSGRPWTRPATRLSASTRMWMYWSITGVEQAIHAAVDRPV